MEMKLELVAVPVSDVDRAKAFYTEQIGFHADHDHQVRDDLRFVQLTPPGSACSIVIGVGMTDMPPGAQKGLQMVVADVKAVREELVKRGALPHGKSCVVRFNLLFSSDSALVCPPRLQGHSSAL